MTPIRTRNTFGTQILLVQQSRDRGVSCRRCKVGKSEECQHRVDLLLGGATTDQERWQHHNAHDFSIYMHRYLLLSLTRDFGILRLHFTSFNTLRLAPKGTIMSLT